MADTNDPFADTGDGDPFADEPTMEPAPDAAAEVAATEPGPPVVDKEGQPVPPAAPAEAPAPAPAPAPTPEPPAAPPAEPAPPAPEPPAPAEAPQEPPAAPETPPESPQPPDPAPAEPEPPAAPPAEPAPPAPAAAAESNGGGGPRGGKGEMRHYKVLYQTGPKQWTEYDLTSALPEGVKVITDDEGELWIEARNNDHATRIGFAILGTPTEGVTVWPTPRGAFKPKRVKPAAPKPEKTRLEIS